MGGCIEQSRSRRLLDHTACVHHRDTVGEIRDHPQIVRDQHHRHAGLGLKVAQKVKDLRLDRRIEGCRRFIGD